MRWLLTALAATLAGLFVWGASLVTNPWLEGRRTELTVVLSLHLVFLVWISWVAIWEWRKSRG